MNLANGIEILCSAGLYHKRGDKMGKEYNEEKLEAKISPEVKEQYIGSTMSKAGRLAMEMNAERKRLNLNGQTAKRLNGKTIKRLNGTGKRLNG